MEKKTFLFVTILLSALSLGAQNGITLTFTCRTTDSLYVKPNYIKVENLDRGWTEILHFPDTVYQLHQLMAWTDVPDHSEQFGLEVSPNPFDGATTVTCGLLAPGEATVELTDLTGRILTTKRIEVPHPDHYSLCVNISFPGAYLLNLKQNGKTATAKLVNTGHGGRDAIEFDGGTKGHRENNHLRSSSKADPPYLFLAGDQLRYTAYAAGNVSYEVLHYPFESDTLTLLFNHFIELGDSLPCPGTPTVTDYDGNIYSTVKIGTQCWMRENLRTTHYADGTEIPLGGELASFTDPLYFNHPAGSLTLAERGYLYNFPAVMHGDSSSHEIPSGVQGICPDGWHVPSLLEWGVLIEYLGSQDEYNCNNYGFYIGKSVAAKTNWPESPYTCCVGHYPHTNNATGFSALSAGYCLGSSFDNAGAFFSTCTFIITISGRGRAAYTLSHNSVTLNYTNLGEQLGLSVRCLRD